MFLLPVRSVREARISRIVGGQRPQNSPLSSRSHVWNSSKQAAALVRISPREQVWSMGSGAHGPSFAAAHALVEVFGTRVQRRATSRVLGLAQTQASGQLHVQPTSSSS